jgi:high-affinity iron transporter
MLAGYLLGLREGLEAALILGVTFGVLNRMRRSELAPSAWLGVGVALVVSIAAAAVLFSVGAELEGRAEEIFEGVTMLLAAAVLTWMILWMGVQGRQVQLGLERDVEQAALRRQASAIFVVAFLAVLREGIETALFLSAAAFQDEQAAVVLGGLAGIATACVLGWGLYRATIRLNLRRFFQVTGWLLILFAAGLFAHGVHEFVEAGLLPAIVDPLWSTEAVLSEASLAGMLLRTLFGYNADPSLLEVLAYVGYFAGVWIALRALRDHKPTPAMAAG